MGKKTKQLQLQNQQNIQKWDLSLKKHTPKKVAKLKRNSSFEDLMSYLSESEEYIYSYHFLKHIGCGKLRKDFQVSHKSMKNCIISAVDFFIKKYSYPKFFQCMFFNDPITYARYGFRRHSFMVQISTEFIPWLMCISAGKSLYKEYFKDLGISKKETFYFVTCTQDYVTTPQHALLYAFIRVACENNNKQEETKKYFQLLSSDNGFIPGLYYRDVRLGFFWKNNFYKELVNFLCKYDLEQVKEGIYEYMDFLETKRNDKNWTFKNRTLNSIKQLSNEWHLEMIKKKVSNTDIKWDPLFQDKQYWETTLKDNVSFSIAELITAKDLAKEGKRQRNCVAGYLQKCVDGNCHIFTALIDSERITIEVSSRTNSIVQARRVFNKECSNNEKAILRNWAKKNNLGFSC